MANRKVSLVRYCKTPVGWRRYPAVIGKNGRIKPNFVAVKGRHFEYPEGHYEVRYYEGSKVRYANVGEDAQEALAACAKHGRLLVARDTADAAGAVIVEERGRVALVPGLARFILATEARDSLIAAKAYKLACDEFLTLSGRRYADEVTADDLLRYQRALRTRGCSPRTIYNRHINTCGFLRFAGVSANAFPKQAPKYEKQLPEVYSAEDIRTFLASLSDDRYRLTFSLALKCGLREQELMHLQWDDIDANQRTLLVRSKPQWGFVIKDKEERSIPVPSDLLELAKAHRGDRQGTGLITGTAGNRPNQKLLRTLKRLAKAAGLNCNKCKACIERGECERWYLHKFRASYATALLRSGLDVRTVQKLMGHSDLESTMRYLRPEEDAALQSRINSIVWA